MNTYAIPQTKSKTAGVAPTQLFANNRTGFKLQDNRQHAIVQQKVNPGFLSDNRPVAQLTREKTKKGTAVGAVGLGIAGAIVGSYVPVVGTVLGGLAGLALGGLAGYWLSKPKIYHNLQADEYRKEVKEFEVYKRQNRKSRSAYTRGTIIKYSKSNSQDFTELLHMGQVLYTYDVSNQLSIGSNVGPIKHAIVAGNKNVKVAGMAVQIASRANDNFGAYQDAQLKARKFEQIVRENKPAALKIIKKYDVGTASEALQKKLSDHEHEVLSNYYQAQNQLQHYLGVMHDLGLLERVKPVVSKNNLVQVDNNSGHYHPEVSAKDEAFEAWHNAGFRNLRWKNFGKK